MYLFRANRDELDLIDYVYSETDNSTINNAEAYRMALEAEFMCCQWLRMAGLKTNWVSGDYTRDMICAGFDIDVKHRALKKVVPTTYWPVANKSLQAQAGSIKLFSAVIPTEPAAGYSDYLVQVIGWLLPDDMKHNQVLLKGDKTPGGLPVTYDFTVVYCSEMRSPLSLITYLEVESARKTSVS
jgi:hypothetical protein